MKTTLSIAITILTLVTSCVSKVKFPISQITPAADITAKIQKQNSPNYLVIITAKNLAASERLDPPKKNYVIWVVSEAGITRNVGYFTQENAVKATYKSSFPYKPVEIFITAEDNEGGCYPMGIEITRTKL
jgi:Flp pilus assembly protein CpaB